MLRYKNLESKTTNKTNFFKFLKFIGKEDLITELNAWEKKLKTKHTELTFFTYIVKYKVSALKNGLLFKVKYSYTCRIGNAPKPQYIENENFEHETKFF